MSLIDVSQVLGNFGEFVGAIAVIATLIYVAVQVRQAKQLALESARAARFQGDLSVMTSIVDADTYLKSLEKVSAVDGHMNEYTGVLIADYDLSVAEANNMTNFCFAWMKFQEHTFLSGITPEDRQMHDSQIGLWLRFPLFQKFWNDSSKQMIDRRFVAHVDKIEQSRK